MSVATPPWVTQVLSLPRFAPYLAAAGGDADQAMALYRWNVEISEAFFTPLHWVETAFRNAVNARLRATYGIEHWWDSAPLDHDGKFKVAEARRVMGLRPATSSVADSIVAELSFGFWVSLLGGRYHRTLWVPTLTRVFPRSSRKAVHTDYRHVLALRNRVMHHEPIHRRHLEADHATLHRLLGQLSPAALADVARRDRVPEILSRRPRT